MELRDLDDAEVAAMAGAEAAAAFSPFLVHSGGGEEH